MGKALDRVAPCLLWIDGAAAALAGAAVLLLAPWLAGLHGLPPGLLQGIGVVNLLYGSYSLSLALRQRRPRALIVLLVAANGLWALACLAMAVRFAGSATAFGLVHLVGEALFVGGLAACEWHWRARLENRPNVQRGPWPAPRLSHRFETSKEPRTEE